MIVLIWAEILKRNDNSLLVFLVQGCLTRRRGLVDSVIISTPCSPLDNSVGAAAQREVHFLWLGASTVLHTTFEPPSSNVPENLSLQRRPPTSTTFDFLFFIGF